MPRPCGGRARLPTIYNDIKMRKNESRTYFLDRAAEKVNRRMLLDEERERMRR